MSELILPATHTPTDTPINMTTNTVSGPSRRGLLKGLGGATLLGAAGLASASSAQAVSREFGAWMVTFARTKIGAKYVWGSQGPNTFDCAGLIRWTYHELTGVYLPVGTYAQFGCSKIGLRPGMKSLSAAGGSLKYGDPVFFWNGSSIGHVGLYVYGGNLLSASGDAHKTSIRSITSFSNHYRGVYCGYWR